MIMASTSDNILADDEALVRIAVDRHTHGSLKHPASAQVRLIRVDCAEILCTQQLRVQRFFQPSDDAFQVSCQAAEAPEGQRRLNSRGIAHLQNSREGAVDGTCSGE